MSRTACTSPPTGRAAVPPPVYRVLRSSGQRLNAETKAFMESRFPSGIGTAFSSGTLQCSDRVTVGRDLPQNSIDHHYAPLAMVDGASATPLELRLKYPYVTG